MNELLVRFLVGGAVVSAFALISDLIKPKSFAGLFGAAPSIALASFGLVIRQKGTAFAAVEARSMVLGAISFLLYAYLMVLLMQKTKHSALSGSLGLLVAWMVVAIGLWRATLG